MTDWKAHIVDLDIRIADLELKITESETGTILGVQTPSLFCATSWALFRQF